MKNKEKKYVIGFGLKKEIGTSFIVELLLRMIILLQAQLISNFINVIIFKKETNSIHKYIVYFLFWLMLYIAFSMLLKIIERNFRNKHRTIMISKLVLKMLNIKDIYLKYSINELKALFEIDVPVIISTGFLVFKSMVINCVFAIVCIGLLVNISWQMTIIILAILLVSYIGELYLTLKINIINFNLREEDVKINSFFTEGINKWEEIRNHNMEQFFFEWYRKIIDKYIAFMNKWVIIWENRNIYMDAKKMVLQYVLIYAIGGIFIGKGIIEGSSLILYGQIFVTMFGFIDSAISSVNHLADSRNNFVKLYKFLELEECKKIKGNKGGHINIKNISFSYAQNKEIFQEFSCDFLAKKINVISGDNGVGKSSLSKIIMGILPIQSGNVIVDGAVLDASYSFLDSDYYSWYCDSCSFLHASLDEIIGEDKKQDVEDYLKYFQLDERVMKFEEGIHTRIIDEKCLSGGEKQRLFLIRALLSKAEVLIFDEPASALDKHNIKLFEKRIDEIKGKKTVILITHDNSLKILGDVLIDLNSHESKISF